MSIFTRTQYGNHSIKRLNHETRKSIDIDASGQDDGGVFISIARNGEEEAYAWLTPEETEFMMLAMASIMAKKELDKEKKNGTH